MTRSPVEATLQTGATETRYHRAGAGVPVLLLFARAMTDPLGAHLFARLAARFRVIVPVLPAGVGPGEPVGGDSSAPAAGDRGVPVPVSKWLRDLIDGLGLVQPSVVVDEAHAAALLRFLLVEPDRVGGVVLVCRDHADPARPAAAIEDRLAGSTHALLVVAVDVAADVAVSAAAAAARMTPFLEQQGRGG